MTANDTTTSGTVERDDVLDVNGVALLLRCSERHVRSLVSAGKLPAPAKVGELTRWSRSVVLAWVNANTGTTTTRAGQTVQVRG